MPARVLVVDDHPVVRGAIRLAIAQAWPEASLCEAASLEAAEALLACGAPFDLVTLDLCLPDGSGLSNLVALRRLAPKARIAIFSALAADDLAASARRLGADAFISKSVTMQEMIATLQSVLAGGRAEPASPPAGAGDALRQALDSLSAAQLRILIALGDGSRNSEIAEAAGVTEATVKAHLTAIYKRLGVQTRTQAVLAARVLSATGSPQDRRSA